MARPARLAALVVAHEPDPALLAALRAALGEAGLPLLVVRNSPLDAAALAALAPLDGVALLGDGANAGLGAGLNLGMAAARARGLTHVLLLDQDSSPDPGLPAALLARAEAEDGAQDGGAGPLAGARPLAAVGPRLVPPPGEGYKPLRYHPRPGGAAGARGGMRPVEFLPSSGTLLPVAAWEAVGPFRADFFIDGIDVEWGFRAWSRGWRVLLAPDLRMAHRWGLPAGSSRRAQILRQGAGRNAFYLRNAVHCLRLPHLPLRWKLRSAARLSAQALLLLAHGRARGLLGAARAGWRGELGPPASPLVSPASPGARRGGPAPRGG